MARLLLLFNTLSSILSLVDALTEKLAGHATKLDAKADVLVARADAITVAAEGLASDAAKARRIAERLAALGR